MGCASCGSGGGTPRGCKNNGTCSSGGCTKLGVFDWLANMELPSGQAPYDILELRFKNSRKAFYRNASNISLQVGDAVAVEASPGYDIGIVSVKGELARIQVKKKSPGLKPMELRKIMRIATQADLDKWKQSRDLEKEAMVQGRTLANNLKLDMKISDVEYQGDLAKATFYYTAEGRVDFRQLIKDMAEKFKIRIEMRQIGSRQEAQKLGGIGSCGRELCCSTWLTDFRTVSTSAARYQQLSLNPQKLAGQCGKLKCCLNFELDMYLDAIKSFPSTETKLFTESGSAFHIKTDVFKRQLWFSYQTSSSAGASLVALTPERVREIAEMNKAGKKPKDLKAYEEQVLNIEPDYDNVDGQDSLNRFDNKFQKNKKRKKGGGKPQGGNQANNNVPSNASITTNSNPNNSNNQGLNRDRNNANQPNKPKGGNTTLQAKEQNNDLKKEGKNLLNPSPNNDLSPNPNRNKNKKRRFKPKGNSENTQSVETKSDNS
jgi:cell fate regulator YaaT (PSP1 superfamily)